MIAVLQYTNGINIVRSYSETVFSTLGDISVNVQGVVIGLVVFFSSLFGLPLLLRFGRKTILFAGNITMMICLFASGFFSLNKDIKYGNYISFTFIILFLFAFEVSGGPVSWLYLAEIMKDRGSAFATFINWVVNLIIGIITPYAVAYLTNFGEDNS